MWKRAVVCGVAILLLAGISPAASAAPSGGVYETVWHPSYRQVGAPMLGVAASGRNGAATSPLCPELARPASRSQLGRERWRCVAGSPPAPSCEARLGVHRGPPAWSGLDCRLGEMVARAFLPSGG